MTDIYPGAAGETPQDGRQTAAPIGPDEVRAAYQTLLKYKAGKANLEKRIIATSSGTSCASGSACAAAAASASR